MEDEAGDPVVVDWRAPVSTPFYRATAADPLELRRRRRFLMTARHVDDLFDEVFDDPDSVDAAHHGGIPDPLLAELERSRTGEMRDIVATIAAEQDVVIRAPLDTCLVVQGGPGHRQDGGRASTGPPSCCSSTGSSSTARACSSSDPNPLFLQYIAQVLPSLGEAATRQTTVERLVGGRVARQDPPEVARLKGDARMAALLRRRRPRPPAPPDRGPVGGHGVGSAADPGRRPGRGGGGDRGPRRARSRSAATRSARGCGGSPGSGTPTRSGRTPRPSAAFDAEMRTNTALEHRRGADLAVAVGAGAREARAHEPAGPRRARPTACSTPTSSGCCCGPSGAKRLDDEPWSLPELVLVDEAEAVLNGVGRTYGHAVVDEAQDLSAMELRAVARRCPSRSMTVLGDLAQATAPGAQSSWDDAVVHLGSPPTASIEELELGYRVPEPILDVANRLLPAVGPGRAGGSVGAARRAGARAGAGHARTDLPPRTAARGARPGRRLVVGGARRARAAGASRWPPRSREAGRRLRHRHPGRAGRRRHAPRPARGEGPRVRRRRGGGAERDPHRRAGRPPPLHRAHPGGAGARHRPRRAAARRPSPPDEGRSGRRQYARSARSPPGRAVTVPNLFLRFVSITAVAGVGLAAVGVALVPAVQVLGDAGRSDDAMIDLGSARPAQLRVRRRRVACSPPSRRRSTGSPCRWRRSRSTPIDAVLAVEDADFYAHDGVNLRATVRALIRNVDEGETVQGGSTITQQVVKEELVGNAQTVDRKAREAVLARRLEEVDDEGRDPRALPQHRVPRQRRLRRAGGRRDLLRRRRRPSSTSRSRRSSPG